MNLLDRVLYGDEPVVKLVAEECGPLVADVYVRDHNNWCTQFVGFEHFLNQGEADVASFLAPFASVSRLEH